jgi:hypothetical protein
METPNFKPAHRLPGRSSQGEKTGSYFDVEKNLKKLE